MSTTLNQQLWTPKRSEAAALLAAGHSYREVAAKVGASLKSIYNWMQDPEFAAEVDRLTMMVGISSRAERLRLAMKVISQKVSEETGRVLTDKDILDWLKFAQSETDGVKLDLSKLASWPRVILMMMIVGSWPTWSNLSSWLLLACSRWLTRNQMVMSRTMISATSSGSGTRFVR